MICNPHSQQYCQKKAEGNMMQALPRCRVFHWRNLNVKLLPRVVGWHYNILGVTNTKKRRRQTLLSKIRHFPDKQSIDKSKSKAIASNSWMVIQGQPTEEKVMNTNICLAQNSSNHHNLNWCSDIFAPWKIVRGTSKPWSQCFGVRKNI